MSEPVKNPSDKNAQTGNELANCLLCQTRKAEKAFKVDATQELLLCNHCISTNRIKNAIKDPDPEKVGILILIWFLGAFFFF